MIFAEYKRGIKNKAFQSLEAVIGKSQEAIQGLERGVVKPIVYQWWARMLFENEWVTTYSIRTIVNWNKIWTNQLGD